MPQQGLRGRRVLLTGASSGIGRAALAEQLSAAGAELLLTARREDRLRQLQEQLGAGVRIVAGDLTDPAVRERLVAGAEAELGGLDLLINNAGRGAIGRFDEAPAERLRQVMEVNLFAPAELTRAALPLLKEGRRPLVVMVASVLGHFAVPLKSEYCASKFALHGLADSLRCELRPQAVDVILVSPSTTRSEFFEHVLGDASQQKSVGSMAPEEAARRILKAIRHRRDAVFPLSARALTWLDFWLPGLLRRWL